GSVAPHRHPLASGAALFEPGRLAVAAPVTGLVLHDLGGNPVYEVRTPAGPRLFDAQDGRPIRIDARLAITVAAQRSDAPVRKVRLLAKPNLEARDHSGPMWRIDFDDKANSSAYVSAETGRFLVMRGDAWRTWDFFWMLHNMDYVNRTSFNHPLIILIAFATLWLSGTGFYLLFKSFGRADVRWLRRKARPLVQPLVK
ncbi:MAG: PepSY domain-containing protein, partial [Sphingomonadaceae bacterium]